MRGYASGEAIDASEILFVGRAAADQLAGIVEGTAGRPVLLVGDTPGYARLGVAIELYPKPDVFRKTVRLRFRIAPAAIKRRGLTVSAQLYDARGGALRLIGAMPSRWRKSRSGPAKGSSSVAPCSSRTSWRWCKG